MFLCLYTQILKPKHQKLFGRRLNDHILGPDPSQSWIIDFMTDDYGPH